MVFNFAENYNPESQVISMNELTKSEKLKRKRYNDAVYFGELNEQFKRHGRGIMMYLNGRVYEGEWFQDVRHGMGYERYQNGCYYLGLFQNGKAHGQGVFTWVTTGEVYDGQWIKGHREGQGIWRNQKGETYIGEWKSNKAEGFGVHSWANGDKYEGEWKNCVKHGRGEDLFANGDRYRGAYVNGKPEGKGIYTWLNGSVYEGDFVGGLKHGKGKWKRAPVEKGGPSNEYSGEYRDDKKWGHGEFKWASGNLYRGQFIDDERSGHGEMKWTDGSAYVGEWDRGIQNGYGKMIFLDGTFKEGYFDNNVYVGQMPTQKLKSQTISHHKNSSTRILDKRGNRNGSQSLTTFNQARPQQKEDYSKTYNIFNKIQTKNYNQALRMTGGFQSANKLKKRLKSPMPGQENKQVSEFSKQSQQFLLERNQSQQSIKKTMPYVQKHTQVKPDIERLAPEQGVQGGVARRHRNIVGGSTVRKSMPQIVMIDGNLDS